VANTLAYYDRKKFYSRVLSPTLDFFSFVTDALSKIS
jgi:hypothetical protein